MWEAWQESHVLNVCLAPELYTSLILPQFESSNTIMTLIPDI